MILEYATGKSPLRMEYSTLVLVLVISSKTTTNVIRAKGATGSSPSTVPGITKYSEYSTIYDKRRLYQDTVPVPLSESVGLVVRYSTTGTKQSYGKLVVLQYQVPAKHVWIC